MLQSQDSDISLLGNLNLEGVSVEHVAMQQKINVKRHMEGGSMMLMFVF